VCAKEARLFEELFLEAYPLAQRAAAVRSAATIQALRVMGLDRADLEQELIFAVWHSLRRFDPLRASLRTFVEKVISMKTVSILRNGRAQKRVAKDSEPLNIGSVQVTVRVEFRVDVSRAIKTLCFGDQLLARLLLHYTPAEIARKLGCSRTAVYRSLDRIGAVFRKFGLEKY
jgi:RNA polymerase sigma factor (sigma-70 family)